MILLSLLFQDVILHGLLLNDLHSFHISSRILSPLHNSKQTPQLVERIVQRDTGVVREVNEMNV